MKHLRNLLFNRIVFALSILGILLSSLGAYPAEAQEGRVPGELPAKRLLQLSAAAAPPPSFVVSPFADEFVTTGAEGGEDHYVPSHGDGTFGPLSNLPNLEVVDGTDVADMDGDGDNDILICQGTSGNVYLYENLGGGSFATRLVATSISTEFSTHLRIQDFNHDGRRDFVVGDNRNQLGTKVYLQAPGGTFFLADTLDTSWTDTGNNLFGVAVGDLDSDGDADIAMLGYNGIGAGQVRFYAGDGTGSFGAPALLFNAGNDFGEQGLTGLAAFDLEGDGDLDLVVGGGFSGTHYLYTNDGVGGFTRPASSAFDVDGHTGVDAFDADHDGDHDLVVAAFGPRRLYYLENLGGVLAAPVEVATLSGLSIGVGAPPLAREIAVALDIKPGSCPNPLNLKSRGVLPAAILGTAGFNVVTIDPATIRLEGVAPIRWSLEDVAAPFAGDPASCSDCTTAGRDGYPDLTLKFDTEAIATALGAVSDRQCRVLRLTGNLRPQLGATPIAGRDVVTILKK